METSSVSTLTDAETAPYLNPVGADADAVHRLQANWMAVSVVQQSRIWDVTFPGTHNSATYEIRNFDRVKKQEAAHGTNATTRTPSGPRTGGGLTTNRAVLKLVERYIKCQEAPIGVQLANGVRFLDLRVCRNMNSGLGEPYCAHGGFKTVPLLEALRDIRGFLNEHESEIVILSIRRDVAARSGTEALDLVESDFYIATYLGKFLGTRLRSNTKVSELLARRQQVIYFFNEIERYLPTQREIRSHGAQTARAGEGFGHQTTRALSRNESAAFVTLGSVLNAEVLPRRLDFAALLKRAKEGTLGAADSVQPPKDYVKEESHEIVKPVGDTTPPTMRSEGDLLASLTVNQAPVPLVEVPTRTATKHVVLPSPSASPVTIEPQLSDAHSSVKLTDLPPTTQNAPQVSPVELADYFSPPDHDLPAKPGCRRSGEKRKRGISVEIERRAQLRDSMLDQERVGKFFAAALNENLNSFEDVGDDTLRNAGDGLAGGPDAAKALDANFFELAWRCGIVQYSPLTARDERESLAEDAFGLAIRGGHGWDVRFPTMPRAKPVRLSKPEALRFRAIGLSREYFHFPLVGKLSRDFIYASPFKTGRTLIEKSWGQTCESNHKFLIKKLQYWAIAHGRKPPRPAYRFRVLAAEVTPPSPDFPQPGTELMKFWAVQSALALTMQPSGLKHVADVVNKQLLKDLIVRDIVCRVNAITHDFMVPQILVTLIYVQLKYLTHRSVQLPVSQGRAQSVSDTFRATPLVQPPHAVTAESSAELSVQVLANESETNAAIIRHQTMAQPSPIVVVEEDSDTGGEPRNEVIEDVVEKQGQPGDLLE